MDNYWMDGLVVNGCIEAIDLPQRDGWIEWIVIGCTGWVDGLLV